MESAVGTEAAVRQELVALLPRLRRFALSIAGARQDADDLLQSALERALGSLHQFRPGTRLDSWMYRIIQNTRIDQVRAASVRPPQVSLDDDGPSTPQIVDGTQDAEQHLVLEATLTAMQSLSEEHRGVLALVCIEGLRYREAADVLGISVGTVMSRLARARKRLNDELERGAGKERTR